MDRNLKVRVDDDDGYDDDIFEEYQSPVADAKNEALYGSANDQEKARNGSVNVISAHCKSLYNEYYGSPDERKEDDEYQDEDNDDDDDDDDDEEESSSDDGSDESDDSDDSEIQSTTSSCSSSSCLNLDVKVVVDGTNEVRGFSERLRNLIKAIQKCCAVDYNSEVNLFYKDVEGDMVSIRGYNDLKYARANHLNGPFKSSTLRLVACLENGSSQSLQKRGVNFDEEYKRETKESHTREDLEEFPSRSSTSLSLVGGFTTLTSSSEKRATAVYSSQSDRIRDSMQLERIRSGSFHWQRGALIGAGSFGNVYSGIDLQSGTRMAVKEVDLSRSSDKRQMEQLGLLQKEIVILSALSHPNIISYIGAEYVDGILRIFLELADERSMKDAIDEFGPLNESLLRRYTLDIVTGLDYLHSKQIIHRDLKPKNLLLDKGIVKLADFGCSTYLMIGEGCSSGQHGTMIGTTIYMAPEVMAEQGGYGRKSDIWSLGITLVEMCTGSAPFRTAAAATYCIFVSKKLPQFPEHMSSEAHFFLARCLEESAKSRASSAELLSHSFLLNQFDHQSMDKSINFKAQYMSSNVTLNPLSDFKSLTLGLRDDRSNSSSKHDSREFDDIADCSNSGSCNGTSFLLSSNP